MSNSYHINSQLISLQQLKRDLLSRELIPSRKTLLEGLEEKIAQLEKAGIDSLHALISALKNKGKMEELWELTGIDLPYLNLLRREVNSYLPKPVSLDMFPGIAVGVIEKLAELGLKNSRQYFEWIESACDPLALSAKTGIPAETLRELAGLSNLARVYGVGPVFARLLYDTGIHSLEEFRESTPEGIISLSERQTGRKADFTVSDLSFSLALARILDPGD